MLGYQNSGWEVVHLAAFGLLCLALGAFVRRVYRSDRLRYLREELVAPRAALVSLTRYPAVTLLLVLCVLAGLGLLLHDFGVRSWLFPDSGTGRFFTGALLMLLYSELVLLSYVRDLEVFRCLRAAGPRNAEGGDTPRDPTLSARAALRTRRALADTSGWLDRPGWWLGRIARDERLLKRSRVNEALKAAHPGAGRGGTAEQRVRDGDRARLAAAPTVVLAHGWYAWWLIALIAAAVVFVEHAAYLGVAATWATLLKDVAGYALGLLVGWAVAAVVLWAADETLENWLGQPGRVTWRMPVGLTAGVGVGAAVFLGLGQLRPLDRRLWLGMALLAGLVAMALVARRSGRLWQERGSPWVYPAVLVLILAATGVAAQALRRHGNPEEVAWVGGLVVAAGWTAACIRRSRLLTPGSLATIPAAFLLLFFGLCALYWATSGAAIPRAGASPWRVVALPLTCFAGAAYALYFFVGTLVPRHPYLGFAGVVALFAYMDGSAIDVPRSELKLAFPDLKLYNDRPVRLDSRDYLLSSYGIVVPLDEHEPGAPTRIGGGRFVVAKDGVGRGDLYVGLPPGYLVPSLLRRGPYDVVLRMPKRVTVTRKTRQGSSVFEIAPGEGVTWENLQNAALLWAIPPQKPDAGLAHDKNIGRYAVFPLRREHDPKVTADLTPYWTYEEDVPPAKGGGGWGWRIAPKDTATADGVNPDHLYLVGNWSFSIVPIADLGSTPDEVEAIAQEDARYEVDWYCLKGAAKGPFYPRLWRSPDSRADRPDESKADGVGLCLQLVRPQVQGVLLQDDLDLTLGLPRPWGEARVMGQKDGRLRLLATVANHWVLPANGAFLRFDDGARDDGEDGVANRFLYRVEDVSRPELGGDGVFRRLEPPPSGPGPEQGPAPVSVLLAVPSASQLDRAADSGKAAVAAVPPPDQPLRLAVYLDVVKVNEAPPPAASPAKPAASPAKPAALPLPSRWEDALRRERVAWQAVFPAVGSQEGIPSEAGLLLDQVDVLRRWKRQLDTMRAAAQARPLPDAIPRRCPCPQIHEARCPEAEAETTATAGDEEETEPGCTCPVRHKLVLVTTNGGGIRSALWAVTVLEYLERQFGPSFPYHVRLITGASGGMVGATYYTETLVPPPGESEPLLPRWRGLTQQLGRQDFFTPAVNHMVFSDIPRLLASPLSVDDDRGQALERAWQGIDRRAGAAFTKTFARLRVEEAQGWRPSLVFTPMIVEDGRRLLVSNLDFNSTPRNLGGMLLEPGSSLLRPQMGQFGSLLPQAAAPGEDLYSLTSVEFFRLFPAAVDLQVGTAARMSATFPLISPAATLPTIPSRSVVDAGYYDNFGVNLVSLWAKSRLVEDWLAENSSGIVIIQIRDHASQVLRTELDSDLRQGHGGSWLEGSFLAGLTGDAIRAVHSRGLLQLSRPLNGYFNSRYAVTSFRNDEQIEDLDNTLNVVPMKPRELRQQVTGAIGYAQERRKGPREALPDLVKIRNTNFPYTTVVFECPVDAALSWDLSNFEAENIRKGMGPEFDAERDRDRTPLGLLNLDPLNDAQRRDLIAYITRDLTSPEAKPYGPLVGDRLVMAVAGVWRNLQRLQLLRRWWVDAVPKQTAVGG